MNECGLDFLEEPKESKHIYQKQLYESFVREDIELDKSLAEKSQAMYMVLDVLHDDMFHFLNNNGREDSDYTLQYCKIVNHAVFL